MDLSGNGMSTAGAWGSECAQSGRTPQAPPTTHLTEKNIKPRDRDQRGLRKVVQNFTPSWFSITMGTGIVSILLHNLPYKGAWIYWISVVFFALNLWAAMVNHPTQSLFLGTFPMGLATIINMIVFVCVPAWGQWTVYLAWALWWADAVIALGTCFCLPFGLMCNHRTELSSMTAAWLLPIVAPIVAAASGGIVANVLPNPTHALWTIVVSYVLWGTGLPLAMAILVIYFHRLAIYKLPSREVIVSVFLPLGPLGQGGFAIMQLGSDAMKVFPVTKSLPAASAAGEILYVLGWIVALIMWGFGLVWLFFAMATISRSKFPFNMGWWGFTFPLGVFTVSTTTIGKEMPSRFFSILGTVFSVMVTLLWIIVAGGTVRKLATGQLLVAPCLKDIKRRDSEAGQMVRKSKDGHQVV